MESIIAARYSLCTSTQGTSNLIEYNLATKETKVIASTVDRTIKWPMQENKTAHPILLKAIDTKNKRLLLQLTGNEYEAYKNEYAVRLWAYYYEKGTWEAVSQILPTMPNGCTTFLNEDSRVWLAIEYGIGPLNASGVWQPQLTIGSNGKISTKLPNIVNGFEQIPIGYSNLLIKPS